MDIEKEVLAILDEVLSLKGRSATLSTRSALLGVLPELDSMAVMAVITTLEERFEFAATDDELDGSIFATVGSLVDFVSRKTLR